MILLGLAGHAGSGKDTVAAYLRDRYGFQIFSFSDALYREVAAAFNLPDESLLRDRATKEIPTELLAPCNCRNTGFQDLIFRIAGAITSLGSLTWMSPRQILQLWGTEFRRAQYPGYWLNAADMWIDSIRHTAPYPEQRCQLFVNTSVRFENEREFIMSRAAPWDGNIWHLHRDATAPVAAHESETPLPVLEGEREIFNNYTVEYLHMGVDQLLSSSARFVRLEPPLPMVEPEAFEPPEFVELDPILNAERN